MHWSEQPDTTAVIILAHPHENIFLRFKNKLALKLYKKFSNF